MSRRLNAATARPALWWRNHRLRAVPSRDVFRNAVISLTSFPRRVGWIHHVIDSLVRQTVMTERVVLYLARSDFPAGVPRGLEARAQGRFEVRLVDANWRSYKKLVYALRDFPGATIITCDDDCIYPMHFVEWLRVAAAETPGVVVCGRGRRMTADGDGWFQPYRAWPPVIERGGASHWLLPTGVGGTLYPPGALPPVATDARLFLDLAPTCDDVWFKAMALRNRVPARCIGGIWDEIRHLPVNRAGALWRVNRDTGNDEAVRRVFRHFGLGPDAIADLEGGMVAEAAQRAAGSG